jgi:hypothetical protein
MTEPNFTINGDEARALILALATSNGQMPARMVIDLWRRLTEISTAQPHMENNNNE